MCVLLTGLKPRPDELDDRNRQCRRRGNKHAHLLDLFPIFTSVIQRRGVESLGLDNLHCTSRPPFGNAVFLDLLGDTKQLVVRLGKALRDLVKVLGEKALAARISMNRQVRDGLLTRDVFKVNVTGTSHVEVDKGNGLGDGHRSTGVVTKVGQKHSHISCNT